jgi:hypothetical protein
MSASRVGWALVVLLSSSVAACGEPSTVEPGTDAGTTVGRDGSMATPDGTAPSSAGLPCDVEDVVWRRCVTCHATPPRNGAPMSLVTRDDFLLPAVTDPSRRVIDLVPIRLADARDPMPEDGPLSTEDRATLDAWLAAGGPERSGTDECTTVEPPDPMVDPIDCTVTHSFLAHGAGDEAFHVPATTSRGANLYQCFAFPSTFGASDQAYGWTPVVDDARVLHHMVVFRVPRAYAPGESFECFTMPAGAQIIAAWAPGGDPFELPPTVGLELPESGDSIVLQIHYWNIPGYTDALDRSGIGLCAGPARGMTASYLNAGTASISIPPMRQRPGPRATRAFSEEHELFRKQVRAFAEKELAPHVDQWERTSSSRTGCSRRRASSGSSARTTPRRSAAAAATTGSASRRARSSRCGAAGVTMGLLVQSDMATPCINDLGTKEQKEEFLAPALRGDKIAALGVSEPGAGSDVAGIRTSAKKDGDDYVINGSKTYITNGTRADFVTLLVKTEPRRRDTAASRSFSFRPTRRASASRRSSRRRATGRATPRSSSSRTAACPSATSSARRARASTT